MLQKPKLFLNYKEFLVVFFLFLALFSIHLNSLYKEYREFVDKPFYYTWVEVLSQYQKTKKRKTYTVLKVYSPDLDLKFFTTIYKPDNYKNKNIRLKLFPSEKITFLDYLSSSFIPSKINSITPKAQTLKDTISKEIAKQHTNPKVIEFYQAIFLATPISKNLRENISKWGVSHLIALSGFHLAILSGIIFLLLKPIYRVAQQRYFPYRFELIDMGFIVLVILGLYVWFVSSPPSLIRSYVMMLIGWIVMILGIELVSFEFLAVVVMLILLFFPKMLFSLGFWFSVLGVFYIFLLLKNVKSKNSFIMTLIISFGIFILMLPLVHMIFPVTSSLQLFSPFLSIGFSLFYPIAILLHILGVGGVFDSLLIGIFETKSGSIDIITPFYIGVIYLLLSIGAIFSKRVFYLLFGVASLFFIYIIRAILSSSNL